MAGRPPAQGAAMLTDAQKADVYFFAGWPQRYVQINTSIEQGLDQLASRPANEALLGNPLTGSPPGLLARARQLFDVTIPSAYKRLKVKQAGKIQLDATGELEALAEQGRILAGAICSVLGIERDKDVFAPTGGGSMATRGGILSQNRGAGNWIGK
jgi:hypothetical protein